jgi:hypothetical protein
MSYVYESQSSYDPVFKREIKRLAPQWLIKNSEGKKTELLALARRGASRPSQKTPLGQAVMTYTRKSRGTYDPIFEREIKRLAPQWFENSEGKKKELLTLAKRGAPRPRRRTPLERALDNYTRKSHGSYDPVFEREIKRLAPQWFRT